MTNLSQEMAAQVKKETFVFLIITFLSTSILTLFVYLISGPIALSPSKIWFVSLQTCMLIPATSAIICLLYFKSPIITKETKIIFAFFLFYVFVFVLESYFQPLIGTLFLPIVALQPQTMHIPILTLIIAFSGILTVFLLNIKKISRKNLVQSKLSFGKNLSTYLVVPVLVSAIIIGSYLINYITGLGIPTREFSLYNFFITLVPSIILSFIFLWPNYFGEEYGWRVYLQDRLFLLFGSYKGVLILGIIWGLWHVPLILAGLNFPGQPMLGIVLMVISTIITGVILSYAVLKTGSVWIAVLLHLILDTIFPVGQYYIAASINSIFSFGTGLYGMAILAVFAFILLKSKVWKTTDKSFESKN